MDKRRRPRAFMDVYFFHKQTFLRLLTRFGAWGPVTWLATIAAAKREFIEGTFTYVGEAEGWEKLFGVDALVLDRPTFTLDDFFKFTGQLKQTRKTRSGHVKNIQITRWEEWQVMARTPHEREQNPSTPPQNTKQTQTERRPIADELQPPNRREENAKSERGKPLSRARDEMWDQLVVELGSAPSTKTERGRWNNALKEIRSAGGSADDIRLRAREYRKRWPGAALTPMALAANWGALEPTGSRLAALGLKCHLCGVEKGSAQSLREHLADVHAIYEVRGAA